MRVIVTSDLHLESCGPEPIRRLVAGMDRERPDLVVLAGDLGNPVHCWEECLSCFLKLQCPVAVLPGNHDLWTAPGQSSADLYQRLLPEVTRSFGFHWLEDGPMRLECGVGIVGSMAWYDYSARAPELNQSDEEIVAGKPRYAADAWRIDWPWDDQHLARECRERVRAHLEALEADPTIREVLVVTHMPTFEEQMERRPHNPEWAAGAPYFGHLTMGSEIAAFPKVRRAIGGHTHIGKADVVERPAHPPIGVAVVSSDYLRPRWITVDFE